MNTRRSWEGAAHILRFNYPMFAAAGVLAVGGAALLAIVTMPIPIRILLTAALALAVGWAILTLLVSHYVYDCFPLFAFDWLRPLVPEGMRWANVHAGFDQTTMHLRAAFPLGEGVPVDLFDPAIMTERSIHRARAFYPAAAGTRHGTYHCLPLEAGSMQAVFFLFAAHELRTAEKRATLFREAARTLTNTGVIVVVEHLRGPATLLAFGPGAFHFFSRDAWLSAGAAAHMTLAAELPLTPFARCLVWRKEM